VETHLLKLSGMLSASEHGDALTSEKVRSWNAQAHELVQKLIQSMTTGSTQPGVTEATKTEATKTETTDSSSPGVRYALVGERVDLSSADAVAGLLDRLGSELRKEPREPVTT
jgi:hypothetical protein